MDKDSQQMGSVVLNDTSDSEDFLESPERIKKPEAPGISHKKNDKKVCIFCIEMIFEIKDILTFSFRCKMKVT